MTNPTDFPYVTRTNVYYKPLEIVEEKSLADACSYKWYNETLCQVNNSVVRLGVFEGDYHWHKHDNDDEFFYVVEGKLVIDLKERRIGKANVESCIRVLHRNQSSPERR